MSEKPFTHFTFPNIKQKFPPVPAPCETEEEFADFVLSLVEGLIKPAQEVGFIDSGSNPAG